MTDIVERLREEPGQYSTLFVKAMFKEAADEIERLRAALKDADKTISRNNSLIGKMAVAIRRLKGAKAS